MGPIVALVAVVMVFSIPLTVIRNSYKLKFEKLKNGTNNSASNQQIRELRQQLGAVLAENDEIKERLKNLEYIVSEDNRQIKLDYEKEQLKIDRDNKFKF